MLYWPDSDALLAFCLQVWSRPKLGDGSSTANTVRNHTIDARGVRFALKLMNFALKVMDYVLTRMNLAFKGALPDRSIRLLSPPREVCSAVIRLLVCCIFIYILHSRSM